MHIVRRVVRSTTANRFKLSFLPEDVFGHTKRRPTANRWVRFSRLTTDLVVFRNTFEEAESRSKIADISLGHRERAIWKRLTAPRRRCVEWLLGRVVAKHAASDFLRRRYSISIEPADIEILSNPSGVPVISFRTNADVPVPIVSISHVDGTAVAIVDDGTTYAGIGVDLERCDRMTPKMERIAFSPDECRLLQQFSGDERKDLATRFWCAREAFAKMTACAIPPTSRALSVERLDLERGEILMRCRLPAHLAVIHTARQGEWVVAAGVLKE